MAKPLKIILSVFSVLLLCIVIAAVVLPLIIDPNDFKPEITDAVKKHTGRTLAIEGDLELSVFPWLGIGTGKMTLSNAPGFPDQPFAVIEESNIKVKLLPLFSRKIVVSRIVLKGLTLNLAKNRQGANNWDDLAARDDASQEPPATQPAPEKTDRKGGTADAQGAHAAIAALQVAGISIEDGAISWNDLQSGSQLHIQQLQLHTDSLALNKAIGIELAFVMRSGDPETSQKITLDTDLTVDERLNKFTLQALHLQAITEGESIPGGKLTVQLDAGIMIDKAAETLVISNLQLNSEPLRITASITGEKIFSAASFHGPVQIVPFNPRQLPVDLPPMRDDQALTRLAMTFDLLATADSATLQNQHITLDDSSIEGFLQIKDFSNPAIDFKYYIDSIDVDRYLPEPGKDKDAADAEEKQPQKPERGAQQDSPSAMAKNPGGVEKNSSEELLPVQTLRELNATGRITIGRLKIQGMLMQDVSVQLNARDGRISSQHSSKKFYRGSYAGNLKINFKGRRPRLSLREKIAAIQIEPLLQDLDSELDMTGTLNMNAALQSSGNSVDALKAALDGNLDFIAKDGVVKGISVQKIVARGEALVKGQPLPKRDKNDQTPYEVIRGSAKIIDGVIRNDDFFVKSSSFRVNGKGSADLRTEKIAYQVAAKLVRREATETEPEKIKGLPVIVDITGSFAKPVYTLDVKSMLTEKNKAKIEKQIDKLDKKYGVGGLLKGLLNKLEQ